MPKMRARLGGEVLPDGIFARVFTLAHKRIKKLEDSVEDVRAMLGCVRSRWPAGFSGDWKDCHP
jgi:hypothetical protein